MTKAANPNLCAAPVKLVCRGLAPCEQDAYFIFAKKAWGADCVQSTPSRLKWLYESNPNSKGMEADLLVLWHGSKIVGAHHRMRLPWRVGDAHVTVASLHDLAVLPAYRRGEGLQLILAALAGETLVALFGLSGASDEIYGRMRVPSVGLSWLERNRNPLAAGFQVLQSRVRPPQERSVSGQSILRNGYEFRRISKPSEEDISEALSLRPVVDAYVDWDVASFRWRHFDENGPKNILLLARSGTRLVGRAVLSVGLRHGLLVGRVVDMIANQPDCQDTMIAVIDQTLSELGISFAFVVTSSHDLAEVWTMRGWSNLDNPPGARWFSRDRSALPRQFWIHGGAWDFGCDKRARG